MSQHLANTHDLLVCEHGAFRPSSHGWNPKQANFKALACIQLERPVQQYVAPYCFPTSTVASGKSMPHCLSKNEPLFQPPRSRDTCGRSQRSPGRSGRAVKYSQIARGNHEPALLTNPPPWRVSNALGASLFWVVKE